MDSNRKTTRILEDVKMNVKMKLSVLWLLWVVTDLAAGMLWLIEPGVIDEIRSGEILGVVVRPELLLLGAVIYLVSLAMAFLSQILKSSINRWTNLILGTVFTVYGITEIIEQAVEPSAHMILMRILMVVFSALIVLLALKWPKQES
jgi:hypothetical protein